MYLGLVLRRWGETHSHANDGQEGGSFLLLTAPWKQESRRPLRATRGSSLFQLKWAGAGGAGEAGGTDLWLGSGNNVGGQTFLCLIIAWLLLVRVVAEIPQAGRE